MRAREDEWRAGRVGSQRWQHRKGLLQPLEQSDDGWDPGRQDLLEGEEGEEREEGKGRDEETRKEGVRKRRGK